ncbi:MAG: hypothetical protein APF76_10100 [Desulfitibacter sp. BRH_c19]|nr:MAG: hypothetical protein APF76_10100 [Desulfitibacter sp. BRH_c19]
MVPDNILVQQVKDGNIASFEMLVARYEKQVYNITYRYTGNRDDAFDLSQEAFLKAYRGIKNFRQESTFKTWVYHIASNVCRDYLRKGKKYIEVSIDESVRGEDGDMEKQFADSNKGPDEVYESKELSEFIQSIIDDLQQEYKEVIVLREIQQLSYEEIAKVLNCSLGTIKSRLNRARKILKEKIIVAGEQYKVDLRQTK